MSTAPSAYTANQANPMTWEEFHSIVDGLIAQLSAYARDSGITYDAVAPLLRSGAIPATMIANKMQIVPMVPVQLKYDYKTRVSTTIIPPTVPSTISAANVKNMLVVDCKTETGKSAQKTAELLRTTFPSAHLHFVSIIKVHGGPAEINGYESQHIGRHTSEAHVDATDTGLRQGITIFPWETTAFELADINAPIDTTRSDID